MYVVVHVSIRELLYYFVQFSFALTTNHAPVDDAQPSVQWSHFGYSFERETMISDKKTLKTLLF